MFGLMTVKRHEAEIERLDNEAFASWNAAKTKGGEWETKYKKAVKEIADQTGTIADLTEANVDLVAKVQTLKGEIEAMRPDAEAMRRKRQRDRDTKAAKRSAA